MVVMSCLTGLEPDSGVVAVHMYVCMETKRIPAVTSLLILKLHSVEYSSLEAEH